MSGRSVGNVFSLALVAALVGGCGAAQALPPQDKAGAETLVLKLATADVVNNNGQSFGPQAFVDNLESVSGGRIKVDVTGHYDNGATDSEVKLIEAIASGDVDGGWPSTRAFANAGIHGLEAVEAPLTITSYAANKALVSGPVAQELLAQLKGTGIAGLGLAVGPLRRPFAAQAPLLGSDDWQGVSFRSFNSPVQSDAIEALGATPFTAGENWVDAVSAGTLRGIEFDIAQYLANGESSLTPYVTANVVLWPKVFVLALSQKRYDALTDQQRTWVQQAAAAATQASVDATYDESSVAQSLCGLGVRFIDASPAQLTSLRNAVEPVIDKLAADPVSGPILAGIQAVAAQYPQVEEPDVPASCRDIASNVPSPSIPATESSLPNGTYRMQVTQADAKRLGVPMEYGPTGTWTLTVEAGTFALSCKFIDQPDIDCGHSHADGATVEAGRLLGTGDTAFFVGDVDMLQKENGCLLPVSQTQDGHCFVIPPYWLDWSLTGDQLMFSNQGGNPDGLEYEIAPWTRIN